MENAWAKGGKFQSLNDLLKRSGLTAAELKILARAGAFQTLYPGRRRALWDVLSKLNKERETPLLDLLEQKSQDPIIEMSYMEEVVADYKMMGLSTGAHPMTFYREWARNLGIRSCADLRTESDAVTLTVAGSVICRQRPETAKGFVFLTLEDETGMANVVVKPNKFEQYRLLLLGSPYLAITGKLQSEQGVLNIIAEEVEPLPPLAGQFTCARGAGT